MLLRLISLQMERERGRWKNDREPRLEPLSLAAAAFDIALIISAFLPTEITSSSVLDGKLTLRDGFTDAVDDVSSPDISAL